MSTTCRSRVWLVAGAVRSRAQLLLPHSPTRTWTPLLLALAITLTAWPTRVQAQSHVTLQLVHDSVLVSDTTTCRIEARRRPELPESKALPPDTIQLEVWKDLDHSAKVKVDVPLIVLLNTERVGTMKSADNTATFDVGPGGLADRVVTVRHVDGNAPLCRVKPFPYIPPANAALDHVTHTDVIAAGDVSDALRTGSATSATATGTLGFHHLSVAEAGNPRRYFPFGREGDKKRAWWSYAYGWFPMDAEELRVVYNVAKSVDSLVGVGGGQFAQAVLIPATGSTGGNRTVDLDYFPHRDYGPGHNQHIGVDIHLTAADAKWAPSQADGTVRTVATRAVILAADVRAKAVVINRPAAEDGNSMSFALTAGPIFRVIRGDIINKKERAVLRDALGDSLRKNFSGYAVGTSFKLRQVTAYADFLCLGCRFLFFGGSDTQVEALQGLQPVIGFQFDAPLFTIRHN